MKLSVYLGRGRRVGEVSAAPSPMKITYDLTSDRLHILLRNAPIYDSLRELTLRSEQANRAGKIIRP